MKGFVLGFACAVCICDVCWARAHHIGLDVLTIIGAAIIVIGTERAPR